VAGLALTLALSLGAGVADAAPKKSKKKEMKKEAEMKKAAKKEVRRSSGGSHKFISGTNTLGRAGLFYGDTADVMPLNQVEGSAHLTFQSSGPSGFTTTNFGIPVGAHFGVAKNIDLSAALLLNIISTPSSTVPGLGTVGGGSSTSFGIDVGGKYKIDSGSRNVPDFSVGADIMIPTQAGGQVVVSPRGVVSYVLEGGLLLNADVAINISTVTYVSVDAGVGIPVGREFSVIAEIGANQMGNGGSILGGGVRVDLDGIKLQGGLGIPLNGGGVQILGGVILASN
jgi:hypothetical protein